MRVDQFPARPRNISSRDRNQNGSRLLSFVYVAQHKPMKHHRDSFVSGSFREGGLWGLFVAAMLLVIFGFGLTLWELRHDLAILAAFRP